jgi:hypothetical protein
MANQLNKDIQIENENQQIDKKQISTYSLLNKIAMN